MPTVNSNPPPLSTSSFLYSFGSLGVVALSGFALNILLARFLDLEVMGRLRLIRSVLDFAAIPASLGMFACAARHVSDSRITPGVRRAVGGTTLVIALAGGAVVALLGVLLSTSGLLLRNAAASRYLAWMFLLMPAFAAAAALRGQIQGLGRIRALALVQAGRSILLLVLGVGLAIAAGLQGWAWAVCCAEVAAAVIALVLVLAGPGLRLDSAMIRPFLVFGAWACMTQTCVALVGSADMVILDHLGRPSPEIAQYSIGMVIFNTALLLPNAFAQSHFSRMTAHGYDGEATWRLFLRYVRVVALAALPVALMLWFLSPLIPWAFGSGYRLSARVFTLLLPAFIVQSVGIMAGNFCVGTGRVRANLLAMMSMGTVNIVLNLLLIPRHGWRGAVMATTVAYVVSTSLSILILHDHRRRSGAGAVP